MKSRPGKPGVLQSVGSQKVGHDLAIEQQMWKLHASHFQYPNFWNFLKSTFVFCISNSSLCESQWTVMMLGGGTAPL